MRKINQQVLSAHPFITEIFETELKREDFLVDELNKLGNYKTSELTCHQITALIG